MRPRTALTRRERQEVSLPRLRTATDHPSPTTPSPLRTRTLRALRLARNLSQGRSRVPRRRAGGLHRQHRAEHGLASPGTLEALFEVFGEDAIATLLGERLWLPRDRKPEPRDLMRVLERMSR